MSRLYIDLKTYTVGDCVSSSSDGGGDEDDSDDLYHNKGNVICVQISASFVSIAAEHGVCIASVA